MKILNWVAVFLLVSPGMGYACGSLTRQSADTSLSVPLGGNAWRKDKDTTGGAIGSDGIVNWTNPKAEFVVFVRFARTGALKLSLDAKSAGGPAPLAITIGRDAKQILITGDAFKSFSAGDYPITDTGYVAIKIKALDNTGKININVRSLLLSGSAVDARTVFVKNNEGDFFYWGRRGPSVHLSYVSPNDEHNAWFYNEVTVPTGNDVLGSYFMACGFGEGYFGMQVNFPTERHILFSVWSPFNTDDPKKIPDNEKIVMLKKGPDVHTGEFGSEGSGGQSYLLYNWKAGNTYRFLLHAHPADSGYTSYTAWFFAPEDGHWRLIASFNRPKTNTYLTHLHSFLENFEPEQGTITRRVFFNNEWVADEKGKWTELTRAKFTVDNTGAKGYRMDYSGGVEGRSFFLKNCGFFNHYTVRNTFFERPAGGKKPDMELDKLP